MKQKHIKITLLLSLQFLALAFFAQSPSLINYQGAARLADGTPIINQQIRIKFDLRQGGSSGSSVASETQTVQTNQLGLFSTQIGSASNLSVINWQGNSIFLQVSMDVTGGTNFTLLGTQQLVSAPYALHASSVPSSYTNNILTIGSSTYALSPTLAVVPATSITVSGLGTVTSAGTNTFNINIPAPTFTNAGPATITGAYPNFTINSAAGATYTNGTGISITAGSVIANTSPNITPTVAVTTTAAAGASVASTGSSFNINVPAPTFTNAGPATITGAYPNFTINSSAGTTYTNGTGISVTSGSVITNTAPNQTVVLSNGGNVTITGTYPSFTLATPTAPSYTSGAGISIASGSIVNTAPNQTVTFNNTGQTLITGTYPNFTIATPTVAAAPTVVAAAAGIATVSTGPNYTVGVQTPTFTNVSQNIITGTYPNFSVNTPTVIAPPTLAAAATGIATVSTGPNYTVGVQTPTFTNVGQTIISGSYPSFSVNTPTIANTSIALSGTAAAGPSISVIGTNSFNINIPPANGAWSLLGNTGTSTLTNFIGTADNVALRFRVFNQNSGAIDQVLNNAYFGFQSGLATTTGSLNAGFGQEALKSLTTSNRNSAFGYQALKNSNGGSNTGIGASALTSNTSGTDNTALGKDALYQNLTGSYNVGIGIGALLNHTSGDNNLALGRDALNGNTTGANNVSLGNLAGYSNFTGSGNVFIGFNAGYNETGSNKFYLANTSTTATPLLYGDFSTNNLGIGTTTANAPLQFNQSISGRKIVLWEGANNDNQVYGFGTSINTLRYQVDASVANHIFYSGINSTSSQELLRVQGNGRIGVNNAAPTATLDITGTVKIADGTQGSGKVLTSDALGNASWQTAAGWGITGNAGTSTLTNFIGTTDNVALKFRVNNVASGAIDPSVSNAFFGYQSGSSLTTGSLNAGFGHTALAANTTGIMNAAVGYRALVNNTSGNGNAALGTDALLFNSSGIFNAGVGLNALRANTTGGQNIAIGKDALSTSTIGSNNVSIGYQSGFSSQGSSNVFLGNAAGYFETGSNKLYIANASGTPLIFGDFANDMVGINTTTPTAALSVDANSLTTRDGIHLSNSRDQIGGSMPLWIDLVTSGQTFGTNTYGRMIRLNNSNTNQIYDMGIGSTSNFFIALGNNYSPAAVNVSTLGNVGINTAGPTANLHVTGTTRLVDGNQAAGKVLTSDAIGNATWQTASASSRVRSVVMEIGAMNMTSAHNVVPATNSVVGGGQRPAVIFPDGTTTQIQFNIPIPSDWNTVSSYTVRILYGSPSTSGNFDMQSLFTVTSLNQNAVTGTSLNNFVISPSATSEGLMEYTFVISSSSTNKSIHFSVRRNGGAGADTSTDPLRLYGVSLDYKD